MPNYDGVEANSFSTVRPAEAPIGIWQHGASVTNPLVVRNASGTIVGGIPTPGAAPVQAVATSGIISVGTPQQHYTLIPLTAASNATSMVLSAGLYDGQYVVLVNREGTNYIQFHATNTTSHVFIASYKITPPACAVGMVWDAGTGFWYPTRPTDA